MRTEILAAFEEQKSMIDALTAVSRYIYLTPTRFNIKYLEKSNTNTKPKSAPSLVLLVSYRLHRLIKGQLNKFIVFVKTNTSMRLGMRRYLVVTSLTN